MPYSNWLFNYACRSGMCVCVCVCVCVCGNLKYSTQKTQNKPDILMDS